MQVTEEQIFVIAKKCHNSIFELVDQVKQAQLMGYPEDDSVFVALADRIKYFVNLWEVHAFLLPQYRYRVGSIENLKY